MSNLFRVLILFFLTGKSLFAQVSCGSTAPVILNQTHPSYINLTDSTPNPSSWIVTQPSANLPNMGYLIALKGARDSSFNDNIIIGADEDGVFVPADIMRYGLSPSDGDSIEIIPFAYDLLQMRIFIDDLFTNMITGTSNECCDLMNLQPQSASLCDSMVVQGIVDSSDIIDLSTYIEFFRYMNKTEEMSVDGFESRLIEFIDYANMFQSAGCGSVSICYAFNPNARYAFPLSNLPIDTILNVNACYSYTSPSGSHTWTNPGAYFDTIPNSMGGDSIMRINLSITAIDTAISVNGFLSNISVIPDPGNTYQWMDCSNGTFTPISGEISSQFSPTVNGSYSVQISRNGCVAMTECYTTNFGNCNSFSTNFYVSQNPNNPFELNLQPIINGSSSNNTIELFFNFGDGNYASISPYDTLSHYYSTFGAYTICMNVADSSMGCFGSFCDTIGVDSTGMLLRGQSGFWIGIQPVLFNPTAVRYEVNLNANKNILQVFPNPNSGVFSIKLPDFHEESGVLQLFDLNGRLLYSKNLIQTQIQEGVVPDNIPPLQSGSYYLRLISGNELYTQKLIIDK